MKSPLATLVASLPINLLTILDNLFNTFIPFRGRLPIFYPRPIIGIGSDFSPTYYITWNIHSRNTGLKVPTRI